MSNLNTPFYLTGGTALSRFYFNHRYSDDLDFFVNDNTDFISLTSRVFSEIETFCSENNLQFDKKKIRITDYFCQCYVEDGDIALKLDFANDIAVHFGELQKTETSFLVDNLRNILSNKITALYRYEPKDIADIWILCKNCEFNWETLFFEAKEKELGLNQILLAEIIQSFPKQKLETIKWMENQNLEQIYSDLQTICDDLIKGFDNSLCKTNTSIYNAQIFEN